MTDRSNTPYTVQFTEIVRQFIRLRRLFKAVLSEDAAQMRGRFEKLASQDKPRSTAEYDLLYTIGVILSRWQGAMTRGDLSQALDVPLSSATRIVDVLVENGYARRLPDPHDRRIVRVTLTETGQVLYQALDESIRKRVERLLQRFTPEEQASLTVLLRKLVEALDEEL